MLKELIEKNKKNNQLIDKFIKRYTRKTRRKIKLTQIEFDEIQPIKEAKKITSIDYSSKQLYKTQKNERINIKLSLKQKIKIGNKVG